MRLSKSEKSEEKSSENLTVIFSDDSEMTFNSKAYAWELTISYLKIERKDGSSRTYFFGVKKVVIQNAEK